MVAGCSFSAVSSLNEYKGTHWSEVLSDNLGWELTNLARQGCSNGGIRLQVEEIIRQRPSFAVITPTFWDRMEIPCRGNPWDWLNKKKSSDGSPPLQDHLQGISGEINGYDPRAGIDNVNYGDNPYRMICETIFSLADNYPHPYRKGTLSGDQHTAMKWYVDQLYDSNWKRQQDIWLMREMSVSLLDSGIPFVISPVLLLKWDHNNYNYWRESFPKYVPDRNIWIDPTTTISACCSKYPSEFDPGYHSSKESQIEYANHVKNHIEKYFDI